MRMLAVKINMMLSKKNMYSLCFMIVTLGYSQGSKEIRLSKQAFSDQNHVFQFLLNNPQQGDQLLPSLKNATKKTGVYDSPILTQESFRSLEVLKKKKGLYDIIIKMNPKGRAKLDQATTDSPDIPVVYVFNDTIYQIRKDSGPILDGKFKVSGLTAAQKDHLISYYKKLPPRALQTAFYKMIDKKKIHSADSLVKLGALVSEGTGLGYRAFKDAYKKQDTLVLNFLKKHNFVPKSKNLREALTYKNLPYIKKYFSARKKTATFQKEINKTFFSEADENTLDVIQLLVELGANVNYKTRSGKNVVNYVASSGDCNVLTYLLDQGIEHTAVQVLLEASYSNRIDVIECLLARDEFHVNLRFPTGESVMQVILETDLTYELADYKNGLAKVSYLLDKGADPSFKDNKGNTPLHILTTTVSSYTDFTNKWATFDPDVVQKEIVKVAKKMILKGADPTAKNNEGLSPLAYAKSKSDISKKRNSDYTIANDQLIKYLETLK